MRPRIYISGPLTSSGNVLDNLERAMQAARALIAAGFAPFCPHLTYHVDPGEEIPHATWMEIELPWVAAADAVFRLPGESQGTDIEVAEAQRRGIPVFATITALVGHYSAYGAHHSERQCVQGPSRPSGRDSTAEQPSTGQNTLEALPAVQA